MGFFSTSHSSGNQVDGSPLAFSTAAVLVGLRLGPRRSMNLGGDICILGVVWLDVRSFGIFRRLIYKFILTKYQLVRSANVFLKMM